MTYYRIHNVYTFDNDYETLVDLTTSHVDDLDSTPLNLPYSNHYLLSPLSHPSHPSYWRPSSKLQRLYDRFQNNILSQWPRIPCVYCGKVLYPQKACWSFYNPSITYPLQQCVPNVSLSFNPNINRIPDLRIPTCESCKKPSTRAHALYSGTLGAFLESNEDNNRVNNVRTLDNDETLRRAAAWLAENNPYLRPFTNLLSSDNTLHTLNDPFPRASHVPTDTNAPSANSRDIVVPNYDFPSEVETPSLLAIVVISSVREAKTSPEYTTTPPTVSYD
ncbi:unnamed protein product [Rhizophagus irregularis]|nr:unnamed protein product [Rhizophagus irregularis]